MSRFVDVGSIASYFESLEDPRHLKNRRHLLGDVLVICVAAVLCGCEGPTAIHRWAVHRKDWLMRYLALPNGVPSRDCLRRVLIAVQPAAFQECFQAWVAAMLTPSANAAGESSEPQRESPDQRLIAIDGKTCRGSKDTAKGLGALHLVSAWASEEGLALGQVATDSKSNEITAIPALLSRIPVQDAIVTIDAMGCQKAIVQQVVAGGGDAVIAVKQNQPKLYAAIDAFFHEQVQRDFEDLQYHRHETQEQGHGRSDGRLYFLAKVPRDFAPSTAWPQVKAIGYAARYTILKNGQEQFDIRYYISTRYMSGKRFSEAVRGHWAIESMHWTLDVTFREDDHRTRERSMGNNLSWLRRFAISLLKRHPADDSLKGKMLSCGYNTNFLAEVLQLQTF